MRRIILLVIVVIALLVIPIPVVLADYSTIEVDSCRVLNMPNTVYKLIQDVESNDSCFYIDAKNIIFDGQGHTITFAKTRTGTAIGVDDIRDLRNITIRNTRIVSGDVVDEGYAGNALDLGNLTEGLIENNSIIVTETPGDCMRINSIYRGFLSSAYGSDILIRGNNLICNGSAIRIDNTQNISVIGNNITVVNNDILSEWPIIFSNGEGFLAEGNRIDNYGATPLELGRHIGATGRGKDIRLLDNVINSRIYATNATEVVFEHNIINCTDEINDPCVGFHSTNNSQILNSKIYGNSDVRSLFLDGGSGYNYVWNNTFDTGFVDDQGTGNVFCVGGVGNEYLNGAYYSGSDPNCGSCECPGAAGVVELDSCRVLTMPNTIYVLTQDITDDQACFAVTADNITLDGNGHIVQLENTSEDVIFLDGNISGFTLKNTKIRANDSCILCAYDDYNIIISNLTVMNNDIYSLNTNATYPEGAQAIHMAYATTKNVLFENNTIESFVVFNIQRGDNWTLRNNHFIAHNVTNTSQYYGYVTFWANNSLIEGNTYKFYTYYDDEHGYGSLSAIGPNLIFRKNKIIVYGDPHRMFLFGIWDDPLSGNNNIIVDNNFTCIGQCYWGSSITLYNMDNSIIKNNSLSFRGFGMEVSKGNNVTIGNNKVYAEYLPYYLYALTNTSFDNNYADILWNGDYAYYALYVRNCNNLTIRNFNMENGENLNYYGGVFHNSTTSVYNSFIEGNKACLYHYSDGETNVYNSEARCFGPDCFNESSHQGCLKARNGGIINVYNTTFNRTYYADENSYINAYWYLNVLSNIEANVKVYDYFNNLVESGITPLEAIIKEFMVNNETLTSYTPHNITLHKEGYQTNSTLITINNTKEIVLVLKHICIDKDGDGYGIGNTTGCPHPGQDGDDNDPGVNPGAPEICDGKDNNCDGIIDNDGDALCDDGSWCNGIEICAGINGCQSGTPINCDDSVGCTDDSCNEDNDSCDHIPNDNYCHADGWYNIGGSYWVDISPCDRELRQDQEYKDYYCDLTTDCQFTITDHKFVVVGYEDNDEDDDGVCDDMDKCSSLIPGGNPWYAEKELKSNHYDSSNWDNVDSYGCSCAQVLYCKPGDNNGEYKFGCSKGTKMIWEEQKAWAPDCQADGMVVMEGISKSFFENTDSDWAPDIIDDDNDNDGISDNEDDMIEDGDPEGDPDYGIPDWHPKSKHNK